MNIPIKGDLDLLGLSSMSTIKDLKKRHKELVATAHPDHGGNPDTFDRIQKAYRRLLKALPENLRCAKCQGLGKVQKIQGFYVVNVVCQSCKGIGYVNEH